MDVNQNIHIPVLLTSIMEKIHQEFSSPNDLVVFDGTLGGGGYSQEFLANNMQVYGSDLDYSVIKNLKSKFKGSNFYPHHGNFSQVIGGFEDDFFDVIIADLGFSSNQLQSSNRGFSYMQDDDEFDLRYDDSQGQPAWQHICGKPVENLWKTIYTYSGENLAKPIAKALKRDSPKYVKDVVASVISGIPPKYRNKTKSILSRVWQAFRILVNDEFVHLHLFLEKSLLKLKSGGILMVVCFHSLEDKLVTKFMRSCSKPVEEDVYGNKMYKYKLLTKKPIQPSEYEIQDNVRSRSASLRILKKI